MKQAVQKGTDCETAHLHRLHFLERHDLFADMDKLQPVIAISTGENELTFNVVDLGIIGEAKSVLNVLKEYLYGNTRNLFSITEKSPAV